MKKKTIAILLTLLALGGQYIEKDSKTLANVKEMSYLCT